MAIIDGVPGIEVGVCVDEIPLADYIESTDDKEFSIYVKLTEEFRHSDPDSAVIAFFFIDGEQVCGFPLRTAGTGSRTICRDRIVSLPNGAYRLDKFKFSPVTTVEDSTASRVERDMKVAKQLGLIQVRLYYIIESLHDASPGISQPAPSQKIFELAEKSLKGRAVSHGTSFVDGGVVRPHFYRCKTKENPFVEFNFKYRSRDALKGEMVIPRSPSLPSPSAVDDLSEEEIRRLAEERLAEIKREKRRNQSVKREFTEVFDLTDDQQPPRVIKMARTPNGEETIDLTEGD